MKPLKELEYYIHNGEMVLYAKAEDIKSAVEYFMSLGEKCYGQSSQYYVLIGILKEAFPALYSEQTKEGINDD